MFRKTITGLRPVATLPRGYAALLAVSLTAAALMTISPASATPTWVDQNNVSHSGLLPKGADVAMAENGTAVATWIRAVNGEDRVFASYSTHGDWTFPEAVSDAGRVVSSPSAAINDQGKAYATWLQKDLNDNDRIAVSPYVGAGDFDGWALITNPLDLSATAPVNVAMDGSGKLFAAYRASNGGALNRIRVTSYLPGTANVTANLSDDTSFAPDIAVNNAGRAVVSWYNAGNGESTIDVRSKAAGTNVWAPAQPTSIAGTYQVDSAVSIGDNDYATVAFSYQNADDDFIVKTSKVTPTGLVGGATHASLEGESGTNVSIDQNDAGDALVTWNADDGTNRVAYATRNQNGAWARGKVTGNLSKATSPKAAISDSGLVAIGYADAGHQHAAYRASSFQLMTHVDGGPQGFVDGETSIDADNQGNVLLTGIVKAADPAQSFVSAAILDTAGPITTTAAPAANTIGTKVNVGWNANDRFSAIGGANLKVRSAAWNGTFGALTLVGQNLPGTSLAYAGLPGRTYCFSTQSKDANNTHGAYSAEKCTTTPVDDRSMGMKKGFKRAKGGAAYQGTYTVAKKKGAVLTLKNVKASRIAILVTKAAKGGKIQVFFGKKKIGTYNLKGSGAKKLVAQKSLGGLKTGTLTIKVVSASGKVVKIDGVIAAK